MLSNTFDTSSLMKVLESFMLTRHSSFKYNHAKLSVCSNPLTFIYRFCGVSNPFIKRNTGENSSSTGIPKVESTGVPGMSKINSTTAVPLPKPKVQKPSPTVGLSHDAKNDIHVKLEEEHGAQNQEKASHVPPNNKKGQPDKNASGTGGALANMWGRASAKSKSDTSLASADNSKQNSAGLNSILEYYFFKTSVCVVFFIKIYCFVCNQLVQRLKLVPMNQLNAEAVMKMLKISM